MSFSEDMKIENEFYDKYFKKYLLSCGYNLIWIYYDDNNIIYKEIQKKNDIDIIIDNGEKNITLSLKTVRKNYTNIFFETISNCSTNTPGWGYYSKADYIVYTFGYPTNIMSYKFEIKNILLLDIFKYPVGYGHTDNLYKTEGRLIPLSEFKNERLNYDYR